MKYFLCLILCVFFASFLFAEGEDSVILAKTSADRLRDIDSVRILVEKISDEHKALGIDEGKIGNFVIGRLKENECYDENSEPYLYININPLQADENVVAVSVNISVNRPVYYPAENRTFVSMASVWQTGSIISFQTESANYIYDILGKMMDKFILDWYKSQIPYKENIRNDKTSEEKKIETPAEKPKDVPKEEPKQEEIKEPKKEGAAPDERSLRRKGKAVA